jgi:hypothetical protein
VQEALVHVVLQDQKAPGANQQGELVAAEFTVAAVGRGEPALKAGTVNHGQGAGALAWGHQLPRAPSLVADPAERLVTVRQDTRQRDGQRKY